MGQTNGGKKTSNDVGLFVAPYKFKLGHNVMEEDRNNIQIVITSWHWQKKDRNGLLHSDMAM